MEIIFHSHANKTHFHKKGCAPSLILKVRVFGTWKWRNILFEVLKSGADGNELRDKTLFLNEDENEESIQINEYYLH